MYTSDYFLPQRSVKLRLREKTALSRTNFNAYSNVLLGISQAFCPIRSGLVTVVHKTVSQNSLILPKSSPQLTVASEISSASLPQVILVSNFQSLRGFTFFFMGFTCSWLSSNRPWWNFGFNSTARQVFSGPVSYTLPNNALNCVSWNVKIFGTPLIPKAIWVWWKKKIFCLSFCESFFFPTSVSLL